LIGMAEGCPRVGHRDVDGEQATRFMTWMESRRRASSEQSMRGILGTAFAASRLCCFSPLLLLAFASSRHLPSGASGAVIRSGLRACVRANLRVGPTGIRMRAGIRSAGRLTAARGARQAAAPGQGRRCTRRAVHKMLTAPSAEAAPLHLTAGTLSAARTS
jgi:hypothetical protein